MSSLARALAVWSAAALVLLAAPVAGGGGETPSEAAAVAVAESAQATPAPSPTPAPAPAATNDAPAGDAAPGPLALLATASRAALTAAGLERVEVDAAGRRLVLWRGGTGPHLVLLHGSGHQAGAWAAVAPGLTGDHTVHVLDLPGHGDSEPVEGPLPMGQVVAGVEAYLLELDGRVTLVGNSFGAWLATIHAHRHPERVERVVLVNGGALFNVPAAGLSLTPADREAARRLMAALRDPGSPALPDAVLDDVVRRAGSGPIGRMLQDPASLMAHLLDGRLGEVAVPVDLLWGASDRLMPIAYAQRMASELPRARLTPLEGCGHIPHGECPERFLATLRDVLALPPPAALAHPPGRGAARLPPAGEARGAGGRRQAPPLPPEACVGSRRRAAGGRPGGTRESRP